MKLTALCISVLVGAALFYAGSLVFRSNKLYSQRIKSAVRGWEGRVYRPDPVLGFAPKRNSIGTQLLAVGPGIPTRHDDEGFRIPVEGSSERRRPFILTLGCSWTYGAACLAEETYPYKLAQHLDGSAINAGVCSYGLAQMLILSERLIPELKPDYVIVQYSPWLTNRAVSHFAPVYFSHLPTPYFAEADDGSLMLAEPAFLTKAFDFDLSPYRRMASAGKGRFSFFMKVGLPLYIHDDFCMLQYKVRSCLGIVKPSTSRTDEVIRLVYGKIKELCRDHNASMIVVGLSKKPEPLDVPRQIRQLGIPVVDAHAEMLARLEETTLSAYNSAYAHFRGDPPHLVDTHPNALAHTIIAEAIAKHIAQASPDKRDERSDRNIVQPNGSEDSIRVHDDMQS